MSEVDRLYAYQTLLSGRRAVSKEEIMATLEVSLATFKRDLAKLRDRLNIPVEYDRDLGGYKLVAGTARTELPGLWLSQEEVLALLTMQNMISTLEPGLLGSKLKPLQQRLDPMLGSQGLTAKTLTERIRIVHAGKRMLALKSFEHVAKATLERRQLKIDHYKRQTNETITRTISPQQLVHYRENWYVDAWCHLRNELRSFSIDAITHCEPLKEQALELNPKEIQKSMQASYGIFSGKPKGWAKLHFTPERARWVKSEEWHPEQRSQLNHDGSYVLEFPYSDERELIGDILRFGSDVKVLEPKSLLITLKSHLSRMCENYATDNT